MTQNELDEFINTIEIGDNRWRKLGDDELIWAYRTADSTTVYYCRYSWFKNTRNLYREFISNADDFLDRLTIWKLSN